MEGKTGKGTGKSELTGFGTGFVLLIPKSRSSHLWKHMVSANGILCPENNFPVRHPVFSQTSVGLKVRLLGIPAVALLRVVHDFLLS
jgi:hypothetical protein